MSDFLSYFKTNWSAMTVSDWVGTILTVVIFLLMFGMYFWVLRPKNKEKNRAPREGCAVALVASKGSSDIV